MTDTRIAYLSGGSNLGDRKLHLQSAIEELREASGVVQRVSAVYETEPVGFLNQPWFLNIALALETRLTPRELLACCRTIEAAHGRIRLFPGAPRPLDLDILLYENLILDEPDLRIPHPRMAERRFVLLPLAEIAPDVHHPVLGETIRTLLAASRDTSAVTWHSELAG